MIQDVFIIGATGNVGSTLVRQIFAKGDTNLNLHVNITRIVGLASSTHYFYAPVGISRDEALAFVEKKGQYEAYDSLFSILDAVRNTHAPDASELVFVDVTAAKGLEPFHKKIIKDTEFGIVTANKNPIALCDYKTFRFLTHDPGRYGFRCSVMAGAEAVNFFQDLKDVNDQPKLIQGCFSGTLGYICSQLEKGKQLSAIVRDAKERGYTEPHPRDDLNGLDVARKLLILARASGYPTEMKDIDVVPFIPDAYFSHDSVERFLAAITELDTSFAVKVQQAKGKGNVLRYVAKMQCENGKPKLTVGLKEVPVASPLGSLAGTSNKIMAVCEAYPADAPYAVEAPGAGLAVTAQNIRRDLLYQLKGRKHLIER